MEIIVVDDASPDDSCAVVRRLMQAALGVPIRLIELSVNSGAAFARNIGMDAARGEYLAFLDADDAWHPEKIAIQLQHFESVPDLFLSSNLSEVKSESYVIEQLLPLDYHSIKRSSVSRNAILLRNPFVTSAVMVRSSPKIRFDSAQRYSEDYRLWLETVLSGLRCEVLQERLVFQFKSLGASGLSARLTQMQENELRNFMLVRKRGLITWLEFWLAVIVSSVKFVRRAVLVGIRRMFCAR